MPTTYNVREIHPSKSVRDEVFDTRELGAGVTFEKGAPLRVPTGDSKFALAGAAADLIAGFATSASAGYDWMRDTFNNVRPKVPVARSDQEFRGTLLGTYADTDNGAEYALGTTVVNGKTVYVIDKAAITAAKVRIVGKDDGVVAGDINVPVRFVVLPAQRQLTTGGN